MTQPVAWGDVLPLMTPNWLDLPDTPVPYYVQAKEGVYLHRRNALGRAVIKDYKTPKKL